MKSFEKEAMQKAYQKEDIKVYKDPEIIRTNRVILL